eukprot:gnl/TRDRNA2_/TRDRNA2_193202_c0_seq1.p1 gnl/TRDRNA2_/TRDRNA2_193202_c0~~gnl/TRDRNA2_/TRDRNA2_193202_c0_seq1.p1  ORF type:complete len:261 (-),score=51.56 gnl/TRDRNA2_/TRDRNA2_193202_c0_seq1:111-893(-)
MSLDANDPRVQELLKDPKVQEAVKKAGKDALNDPNVQKQIVDTCKEKFPQIAAQAAQQVQVWANDPEVRKQAYFYAGMAGQYALKYGGEAAENTLHLIEQGPAGVRLLAFGSSTASCVVGVMHVIDFSKIFGHLFMWILSVYQIMFALTTMLFEAKPEWIQKVGFANSYQEMLMQKAPFLSEVMGRGLFYIFQGTMWVGHFDFGEFLSLLVGLALIAVGVLHVLMAYGVMPQQVAEKLRTKGSEYGLLAQDSSAPAARGP